MIKKLNILQVSPAFRLAGGGQVVATLSLTKQLAAHHAIDTLATQVGLTQKQIRPIEFDTLVDDAVCGGRVVYTKYYGYANFTFSPQALFWLIKHIHRYDVVVLHGVWNFPIVVAALVCKFAKVPYTVFPHGSLYPETIALGLSSIKRVMLRLCVKRLLTCAKRVAFTTQDEARKVAAYLQIPFSPFVIPNIVDALEYSVLPMRGEFRKNYGINDTDLVMLYFGRVTKKKGIDFAVKALASLRSVFQRKLILVIAGGEEGDYKFTLLELIHRLGVQDLVLFTGLLSRQQGKSALVDGDVFVLPSLSENFGMAVVESMLCGLPVVISNNVGLCDDISKADAGVVVSLDAEAKALSAGLYKVLSDQPYAKGLAERAHLFAKKNYDAPAVNEKLNQLLSELCEGAARVA